ncbi:hypothetical protein B0H15DRAFT_119362 [Mycena belliarum]|uniref:Uncharacterized protein n=1 Tax=Mycena belliarum TaxID=1033014 RepID=A0AAD6XI22_9AGAR|nr:hypothetical protein B0H15DRAFT_119362 [Mycena belliae]
MGSVLNARKEDKEYVKLQVECTGAAQAVVRRGDEAGVSGNEPLVESHHYAPAGPQDESTFAVPPPWLQPPPSSSSQPGVPALCAPKAMCPLCPRMALMHISYRDVLRHRSIVPPSVFDLRSPGGRRASLLHPLAFAAVISSARLLSPPRARSRALSHCLALAPMILPQRRSSIFQSPLPRRPLVCPRLPPPSSVASHRNERSTRPIQTPRVPPLLRNRRRPRTLRQRTHITICASSPALRLASTETLPILWRCPPPCITAVLSSFTLWTSCAHVNLPILPRPLSPALCLAPARPALVSSDNSSNPPRCPAPSLSILARTSERSARPI